MKPGYLLGIALATAALGAACSEATGQLSNGQGLDGAEGSAGPNAGNKDTKTKTGESTDVSLSPPGQKAEPSSIPVPTNSPAGKEFYITNVHPFLASTCGGCHSDAGPGPTWLTPADPEKSYAQLFQVGYVVQQSRIVQKPAHGGSTTNVLTSAQIATYNQWVDMELKDGGTKATPNVLEKLGSCFDRQKFDAMQMGQWRTTRRTTDNNTNNVTPWNENANNCTGCNNAPCTTCHSADPATNFNNAVGNPLLPADTTFENTKRTSPAYITKFFGVSPDGKPIASDGIKKKSDATKKDRAYTHPMYQLTANQQTGLEAFVNDVITKYNAGSCGK